jgi:hypothetical protein
LSEEGEVLRAWFSEDAGDGNGVAVDPWDNILVAGGLSIDGSTDLWFAKLDEGPEILWKNTASGDALGNDVALGIAVGSDGTVAVAGKIIENSGGANAWIGSFAP